MKHLLSFIVGVFLTFTIITNQDNDTLDPIPGYEPTHAEVLDYDRAMAFEWAKYNSAEPVFANTNLCE